MKRHYLGIIALGALGLQNVYAEDIKANENDTIKTYNMGEVIVTSSTKETNNLRTLPGSVSILSPQMISGRQIDALKDISSFVPNLYMPDYGAKLTSAIYIRGIGARSSGQSVGLYVDNVPYLDKSTFDFELTITGKPSSGFSRSVRPWPPGNPKRRSDERGVVAAAPLCRGVCLVGVFPPAADGT
jgi:hypothetical protein